MLDMYAQYLVADIQNRLSLSSLLCCLCTSVVKRNSVGQNRLFVHHGHSSFQFLCSVYEDYDSASFATSVKPVSVNPRLTQGVSGTVEPDDAKESTPPGK